MPFKSLALRAASMVLIVGTALATALTLAPAQASPSVPNSGRTSQAPLGAAGVSPYGAPGNMPAILTGIVDGAAGQPLTAACVVASGPGGSALAVTQSDGRYVLSLRRPGRYTVRYSICAGSAAVPGSIAKVTVAAGQQRQLASVRLRAMSAFPSSTPAGAWPGVPAGFPEPPMARHGAATGVLAGTAAKPGAIAGVVTGGGKSLSNICVYAIGPSYRFSSTSRAGKFRITSLNPGRYIVFYVANYFCGKNTGNWLPQYFKNDYGPAYSGKPTKVLVRAGKTTSGIDAALRLGGQISGTVRSRGGKFAPRVCVWAQGQDGKNPVYGFSVSAENGGYVLHSMYPGKYVVVFVPEECGSKGNYIPQWWRDSATVKGATKIVITSGLSVRKVDAALAPGAIISGVVRAGGSHGALLKGICVSARPIPPTGPYPSNPAAVTGKNGSYQLIGLATGKYSVYFDRGCGNNGNYLPAQRLISVVAGRTTSGFDGFMPAGAIISGTVTGPHGAPVRGICVSVSGASNYNSAVTGANGEYSAIALESGRYTLGFTGGCGNSGSYAPQFYRGQTNSAAASPVTATAGQTTAGIDAAMQLGGTITGTVTQSDGAKLNNVCVSAVSPSLENIYFPFNIQSTVNGQYTIRNLEPGSYAVNFGCFGQNHYLASQWFRDQPAISTADYVSALVGRITSGVSAVLRQGGAITGVVTSAAGAKLRGICVQAIPRGATTTALVNFGDTSVAFTNSAGVYRISRLITARYDIQFGCSSASYANQWYRHAGSRAAATPVAVTNNVTATGIDAVLTAGGSISGQVTSGANHPQARVCVTVNDTADSSEGAAVTNSDGRYAVKNLSSGTYQVSFSDCGIGNGHIRLGSAVRQGAVKVVASRAVTGVNEKLAPAGAISGTVLGGLAARPQAGACVVAVPAGANIPSFVYRAAISGSGGSYRVSDLAPGAYDVYFGDPFCFDGASGYAAQWYDAKASQATATAVIVKASEQTTGIDATLGAEGAIGGTVTSSGAPVAGECVTATALKPALDPVYGATPSPVIAVTGADGTYTLVGLQPGKYVAQFSSGCGDFGFKTQWWDNSQSAVKASVITVSANTTVTGINAAVHR